VKAESNIDVYLEVGRRRTFAGAVAWPGWCRSGRDEDDALAALLAAAPRYAGALRASGLGFRAPPSTSVFKITERLPGNATTDFGAPGAPPGSDEGRVPAPEARLQAILRASWRAFDVAAAAAAGLPLRKGPRGGGRDLDEIMRHVLGAEEAYLRSLGSKYAIGTGDIDEEAKRIRKAVLEAFAAAAPHGRPPPGPRGGARWSPRYFVRRVAWHVLDHAWEIEDRMP
jgi:hypothetical protein